MGLDAFTNVKKAISDLINELKVKKADQYKKREYCVASLDGNDTAMDETKFKLEDLTARVGELEGQLKELNTKIEGTVNSIAELKVDIARATLSRKEENAEYQQVFNDQTVTIEILARAKQKLTDYYNAKKSFLAEGQPGGPVGLKAGGYKKQGSGGVTQMIDMIISDAKVSLAEARFLFLLLA